MYIYIYYFIITKASIIHNGSILVIIASHLSCVCTLRALWQCHSPKHKHRCVCITYEQNMFINPPPQPSCQRLAQDLGNPQTESCIAEWGLSSLVLGVEIVFTYSCSHVFRWIPSGSCRLTSLTP